VRYHRDGRIVYAGAHEEIIVVRGGRAQCLPTSGPWIGLVRSIRAHLQDAEHRLDDGDLVVLYTDGVVKAANARGELFGSERLRVELERLHDAPVDRIRDEVVDAVTRWTHTQTDDVTLLVARYRA
jgi:serine phosphatase RsbU (regulator of sigma subunit)